jgi:hypothetical protein
MKHTYKIAVVLLAMLWTACAEPDYPTPAPTVTILTSKITVFHAIAGAPRVQVKLDNVATPKDTIRYEAATNNKFYHSVTTNAPAGPIRLVTAADLATGANLATNRNALVSGTNYSYFVINTPQTINGVPNTPAPFVQRVTDDLAAADVGFAKVRFLNFSYDASYVKITNVGGATTIFSSRKYNELTNGSSNFANFISMAAGTYTFEMRSVADNTLLQTFTDVKFDSKGVYTIYSKGLVAGTDDEALGYVVFKH